MQIYTVCEASPWRPSVIYQITFGLTPSHSTFLLMTNFLLDTHLAFHIIIRPPYNNSYKSESWISSLTCTYLRYISHITRFTVCLMCKLITSGYAITSYWQSVSVFFILWFVENLHISQMFQFIVMMLLCNMKSLFVLHFFHRSAATFKGQLTMMKVTTSNTPSVNNWVIEALSVSQIIPSEEHGPACNSHKTAEKQSSLI